MESNKKSPLSSIKTWFWLLIVVLGVLAVSMILGFILRRIGVSHDVSRAIEGSIQYFLMGMFSLVIRKTWLKPESGAKRAGLLVLCLCFWSQPLFYLALRYLGLNSEIAVDFSPVFVWALSWTAIFWMLKKMQQEG